jgi:hypothetical protein
VAWKRQDGPLDNDPQPAQRTIHPKQLDSQAPTRAIGHDTFHNDAHSIKELLWNAFHICPVAIAITYGKSIENKDRF